MLLTMVVLQYRYYKKICINSVVLLMRAIFLNFSVLPFLWHLQTWCLGCCFIVLSLYSLPKPSCLENSAFTLAEYQSVSLTEEQRVCPPYVGRAYLHPAICNQSNCCIPHSDFYNSSNYFSFLYLVTFDINYYDELNKIQSPYERGK